MCNQVVVKIKFDERRCGSVGNRYRFDSVLAKADTLSILACAKKDLIHVRYLQLFEPLKPQRVQIGNFAVYQLYLVFIVRGIIKQIFVCGKLFWWRSLVFGIFCFALDLCMWVSRFIRQRQLVQSEFSIPAFAIPRLVVFLVLLVCSIRVCCRSGVAFGLRGWGLLSHGRDAGVLERVSVFKMQKSCLSERRERDIVSVVVRD